MHYKLCHYVKEPRLYLHTTFPFDMASFKRAGTPCASHSATANNGLPPLGTQHTRRELRNNPWLSSGGWCGLPVASGIRTAKFC